VENAARIPVDVLLVLLDNHAQPGEVQVGVRRLERIVGPLDQIDPHRQGVLALRQLQTETQSAIPRVEGDAEHVRPLREPPVLDARYRVDESLQRAARIQSPKQYSAPLDRDDEDRRWNHVLGVRVAPDILFQRGDGTALRQRRQFANH
jgi:hypothetical protein